ncbi:hypothetical protein SVAN01_06971 [Stagonosporopsis vannaccii]|nr:hypothetical protein SVAN01_06971 [Stagonosporopsis vannaccii]
MRAAWVTLSPYLQRGSRPWPSHVHLLVRPLHSAQLVPFRPLPYKKLACPHLVVCLADNLCPHAGLLSPGLSLFLS